jgi:hypothetical protein
MAQAVEHLPSKREVQTPVPFKKKKKEGKGRCSPFNRGVSGCEDHPKLWGTLVRVSNILQTSVLGCKESKLGLAAHFPLKS